MKNPFYESAESSLYLTTQRLFDEGILDPEKDIVSAPYDTVLFHGGCPDGFGSAWAFYRKWKADPTVRYAGVFHGKPLSMQQREELIRGRRVLMVDFTFPDHEMDILVHEAAYVFCIDHHITGLGRVVEWKVPHIFDENKCGAVLTWEYVHPDTSVPEMLLYVQDRDLWDWNLENSREISAATYSYPQAFKTWDEMHDQFEQGLKSQLIREGETLLRAKEMMVTRKSWQMPTMVKIGDYVVPAINVTENESEIGNALCLKYPDCPFAAIYRDIHEQDGTTRRRWSLRSIGEFDVSVVAKLYGGGGHAHAAGFMQSISSPRVV